MFSNLFLGLVHKSDQMSTNDNLHQLMLRQSLLWYAQATILRCRKVFWQITHLFVSSAVEVEENLNAPITVAAGQTDEIWKPKLLDVKLFDSTSFPLGQFDFILIIYNLIPTIAPPSLEQFETGCTGSEHLHFQLPQLPIDN